MESANIMNREKSLFEQMGGTYRQVGDYLIPNIVLKPETQMEQIGKYGFLRESYLKEHCKARYQSLLLQDKLGEHLLEVNRAAKEREEVILKQLEVSDPLPDKAADQMAWVQAVNRHKAIAEEIILAELIYV